MEKISVNSIEGSALVNETVDSLLKETGGSITYERMKEKLKDKGITEFSRGRYTSRLTHYRRENKPQKIL